MGLIVQKFGGSSVRDRERLLRAMRIVRRTWEQGDDVVVVLSAQGDTTDALLARARELTEEPPLRELDALLATGETASVALGAIALASLGVPAVSLSGWQVPVGTDGTHGGANVRSVCPTARRLAAVSCDQMRRGACGLPRRGALYHLYGRGRRLYHRSARVPDGAAARRRFLRPDAPPCRERRAGAP